jgi:hypothetical protein
MTKFQDRYAEPHIDYSDFQVTPPWERSQVGSPSESGKIPYYGKVYDSHRSFQFLWLHFYSIILHTQPYKAGWAGIREALFGFCKKIGQHKMGTILVTMALFWAAQRA